MVEEANPDMEQVRLEVVDIWHFGLSALFEPDADLEALAGQIAAEFMERPEGLAVTVVPPSVSTRPLRRWRSMLSKPRIFRDAVSRH